MAKRKAKNKNSSYKLIVKHSIYPEGKTFKNSEYHEHIEALNDRFGDGSIAKKEGLVQPKVDNTVFAYTNEHGERLYSSNQKPNIVKVTLQSKEILPSEILDPMKFSTVNEQGVEVYTPNKKRKAPVAVPVKTPSVPKFAEQKSEVLSPISYRVVTVTEEQKADALRRAKEREAREYGNVTSWNKKYGLK